MAYQLKNRVWFATATTGTGAVTVGAAVANTAGQFITPAQAGFANGDTFPYVIVDGTNWEEGVGTYSTTGPSFTRAVSQSLISGTVGTTAVTLSGAATVMVTLRAEDVLSAVAVRQTVLTGPSTYGVPAFFPASVAALTLSTTGVSSSAPLIFTAANGFASMGDVDVTYVATANLSWSALAMNSTVFLYVNAQSGATGSTALAPISQYSGAPATTAGQFTFNIAEMRGYLGNGTTAPQTPIVFVGEAVTTAVAITSTIAYAYNGYYESGWTQNLPTSVSASTFSAPSALGVSGGVAQLVAQFTSAVAPFSVGDQISQVYYPGANNYDKILLAPFNTRTVTKLAIGSEAYGESIGGFGAGYYALALNDQAGNGFPSGLVALSSTAVKWKFIARRGW